ncbi:hypothetical protein AG1IA_03672 [Rhizoctonia solani AG-1 IA]|uniref:Uncharacterized protein n=1 Tax=Thanatephorus cucumeris (strain AG1-IA) TaxID=983506 RepID=L8WZQ7_THACA|nr:hypothetical protein AG1IA_03672 [Rhizoctonia solani AG-1 IA]
MLSMTSARRPYIIYPWLNDYAYLLHLRSSYESIDPHRHPRTGPKIIPPCYWVQLNIAQLADQIDAPFVDSVCINYHFPDFRGDHFTHPSCGSRILSCLVDIWFYTKNSQDADKYRQEIQVVFKTNPNTYIVEKLKPGLTERAKHTMAEQNYNSTWGHDNS